MESTAKYGASLGLQDFTVMMAGHGLSVSSTLMYYDRAYALEQLQIAHALADAPLREMAMKLFQYFERARPGIEYLV